MNQTMNEEREKLSELLHEIWSDWVRYLFGSTFTSDVDTFDADGNNVTQYERIIPYYITDRWSKQMQTPYKDLSEEEKDKDREQADKILTLLKK